jgi:hypothetical protein
LSEIIKLEPSTHYIPAMAGQRKGPSGLPVEKMTLTSEVHNTSLLYEIDALLNSDNGEIDVTGVYIYNSW